MILVNEDTIRLRVDADAVEHGTGRDPDLAQVRLHQLAVFGGGLPARREIAKALLGESA